MIEFKFCLHEREIQPFLPLQAASFGGLTSSEAAVNKPIDDLYRNASVKALRRTKRGVFQLSGIIKCITGCKPLSYRRYGCFCGYMGAGKEDIRSVKKFAVNFHSEGSPSESPLESLRSDLPSDSASN